MALLLPVLFSSGCAPPLTAPISEIEEGAASQDVIVRTVQPEKTPRVQTVFSEAEPTHAAVENEPAPALWEQSDADAALVAEHPPSTPRPEPEDGDFVRIDAYIPGILVELRYAAENNFVGEIIYDFSDAWLRYGTVKKLAEAQVELNEYGYGIKIWDAFRPVSSQFVLWDKVPNSRYVANPYAGYSSHSSGNTVDITLVDSDGNELEMPTDFDEFSLRADRDFSDVTETAAQNARLMEGAMIRAGFAPYSAEWWHFSDTVYYAVDTAFEPYEHLEASHASIWGE